MEANKNNTVLIVEDDLGVQKQLKWALSDFSPVMATDRESALAAIRRYEPKVVTLDLGLPPDPANASEGLRTLEEILNLVPTTKVIVITGNDDKENALQAIALGAHDFYAKPIDDEILGVMVRRAFWVAGLEHENRQLKKADLSDHGIIGASPVVTQVCRMVERVANTEVSTLLLGESGTGKELFARAIHDGGDRKTQPFIAINCASIPENLLESELFGFERGAFTGAHRTTKGKIECAHGGTLFLDEIGDMPFSLQAKLLRFLQEKVIERIGGRREIPVDVKVVCATHQNLQQMVQQSAFREDLFYRISEVTINIPPLRERGEDVLLLARTFLMRFAKQMGANVNGFSDDASQALLSYTWPGNIRELQNKIKSAVIMADGRQLTAFDLMLPGSGEAEAGAMPLNLRVIREEAERVAVQRAIDYSDGNISQTASLLGISRPTLYSLLEKYGLERNSPN